MTIGDKLALAYLAWSCSLLVVVPLWFWVTDRPDR